MATNITMCLFLNNLVVRRNLTSPLLSYSNTWAMGLYITLALCGCPQTNLFHLVPHTSPTQDCLNMLFKSLPKYFLFYIQKDQGDKIKHQTATA